MIKWVVHPVIRLRLPVTSLMTVLTVNERRWLFFLVATGDTSVLQHFMHGYKCPCTKWPPLRLLETCRGASEWRQQLSKARVWWRITDAINRELDCLIELKPPQAGRSSSPQLSNEGHSRTSERHHWFTDTIKPELALPSGAHFTFTLNYSAEPTGHFNDVAHTAASDSFCSLFLSSVYVHVPSIILVLLLFHYLYYS